MLNNADNELLVRIENGAPMSQLMRKYWLPVFRSEDLEAGGAPRPVTLLGERLVAFRDTSGEVGLLDEYCPHRGASLTLARNVDCSLQCLYHGWRVDREGRVVETPSEPDDATFKDRIRQVAYPVRESGGMVWAYLGDPAETPEFPAFNWAEADPSHTAILRVRLSCNWAQALEGVIDSAHVSFLHTDYVGRLANGEDAYEGGGESLLSKVALDGHPKLKIENTPYGFRYGAIRDAHRDEDGAPVKYVRVTHFVAPVWGLIPTRQGWSFAQAFVPVDDHHTMFYFVLHLEDAPLKPGQRELLAEWNGITGLDADFALPRHTAANNWGQDRAAMTAGTSFSGMGGYPPLEDIAVQESMGPVYDRSREHLGTSDVAVIRMRRIMLAAVRALDTGDRTPPALAGGFDYHAIHAEEAILELDQEWTVVGNPRPTSPASTQV
ncbi:Rieske 2Fe-2S domain-containing protein [Pseudonocardia xishanensis]|uniref:Rieske 2Fe-2S domain-containing protein n=1 Tax=Pseudonocardia xishanensis TaxID=630995 RepID=A0ABP8RU96_9PSEU